MHGLLLGRAGWRRDASLKSTGISMLFAADQKIITMPAWIMSRRVRTPMLLMGVIEFLIASSSMYVAGFVVFGSIAECEAVIGPMRSRAALVGTAIVMSLIAVGLYQFNQRTNFREVAVRVLVGLAGGCIALGIIFYALSAASVSEMMVVIAFAYTTFLLLLVRYFFVSTVDDNVFRHRSLVFGAGDRAAAISRLRRRADRRGFLIVGQVAAPGDRSHEECARVELKGRSLTQLAMERYADEIVVALDDRRGNLPVRDLLDARLAGINVIDLLEFLERETGKIRVDLVNTGWLVFSPGFRTNGLRRTAKRMLDAVASAILILVTIPVMLLIAVAIKLNDGRNAPLLYRQVRVGRGGKKFEILKFRSMSVDAESDGKARWASCNDCRVTRVGRILRQYRLDELPQLFNILRGEMSLVGPRPERPEFVAELQKAIPFYSERHTVKPGLTGWAQLRYTYGATEEDALEKLQYELYYIKNYSLVLDVVILLQTVEVVLWGKGAR